MNCTKNFCFVKKVKLEKREREHGNRYSYVYL